MELLSVQLEGTEFSLLFVVLEFMIKEDEEGLRKSKKHDVVKKFWEYLKWNRIQKFMRSRWIEWNDDDLLDLKE